MPPFGGPGLPLVRRLLGPALAAMLGLAAAQQANRDARALADFAARMRQYAELRARAEAKLPKLADKSDAIAVVAHQEALAVTIRAARAKARQGDLIGADAALPIRRTLAAALEGPEGGKIRALLDEDRPAALFVHINAAYPETEPLGTVPPRLLRDLPRLPEDVEYRFIGKTLLLRDARANLILDFLPKALP